MLGCTVVTKDAGTILAVKHQSRSNCPWSRIFKRFVIKILTRSRRFPAPMFKQLLLNFPFKSSKAKAKPDNLKTLRVKRPSEEEPLLTIPKRRRRSTKPVKLEPIKKLKVMTPVLGGDEIGNRECRRFNLKYRPSDLLHEDVWPALDDNTPEGVVVDTKDKDKTLADHFAALRLGRLKTDLELSQVLTDRLSQIRDHKQVATHHRHIDVTSSPFFSRLPAASRDAILGHMQARLHEGPTSRKSPLRKRELKYYQKHQQIM